MGMKGSILMFFTIFCGLVAAWSSSDDRFIKKYAMMKIYESCFGPEVVKQIRKEMTAACQKCASLSQPAIILPPPSAASSAGSSSSENPKSPLQPGVIHASQKPGDFQLSPSQQPQDDIKHENIQENFIPQQPLFDTEKLHQAILSYRPSTSPFPLASPQFRPFIGGGTPPIYAGFAAPSPFFYPAATPGQFASPFAQYPQFPAAFYPQYFGNSQRMSREMNLRDQINSLTNRFNGRVRNVTCVMQELGYLDDNLEPNFDKIIERIANLPVEDELKRDMQDGVTFCQKFSQCIPEYKKENSPLSRELVKPMFFFKCYKHKKLEACIMKDVRERFTQDTDTDFESLAEGIRSDEHRQFRSSKTMKYEPTSSEIDSEQFANELYAFLYGGNDFDSIF